MEWEGFSIEKEEILEMLDFCIKENPVLQLARNSVNKWILRCIYIKEEYVTAPSDEFFNKAKKHLSLVRRKILELSKKHKYILSHYMTVLKSLDYSLWHSIFIAYDDDLIGKKFWETMISGDILDERRTKYFLETKSEMGTNTSISTEDQIEKISQTFLSNTTESKSYTVVNVLQKALFVVLLGVWAYRSWSAILKHEQNEEKDTISSSHTVKISDSKTYIPFTDIENLDYDSLQLRSLHVEWAYILQNPENLFPWDLDAEHAWLSVEDREKLQMLVAGFNFGKFSDVVYQLMEANIQRRQERSQEIEHIPQEELLEQCLFDDLFFYTLPPEIRWLHDHKSKDNINIILNTEIDDKDEFLEVLTHEVFHSFFDKNDGYVAAEGKTHLLTIENMRKYYDQDIFDSNHPYTPFVTYCWIVDKAYPMDENMKQYLPYLNMVTSKEWVQWEKWNALSELLNEIGHDNPSFCLPPQWQIFIGWWHEAIHWLVAQDNTISPQMKAYFQTLLADYKGIELFQHDGDSGEEKAKYLQDRYDTNKDNSAYNHTEPLSPFFDDGTGMPISDKNKEKNTVPDTEDHDDTSSREGSEFSISDFLSERRFHLDDLSTIFWLPIFLILVFLLWLYRKDILTSEQLDDVREFVDAHIKKIHDTTDNTVLPLLTSFKNALLFEKHTENENEDTSHLVLGEYREQRYLEATQATSFNSLWGLRLSFIMVSLLPIFTTLLFTESGSWIKAPIAMSTMLFYIYQWHIVAHKGKDTIIWKWFEEQLGKRLDIITKHYGNTWIVGLYDELYKNLPEEEKWLFKEVKIRPMFKETPEKIFEEFGEDVNLYKETLSDFMNISLYNYKENTIRKEYFSNVTLLKELKGTLNLSDPSECEPINDKRVGVFFFEILPQECTWKKIKDKQKTLEKNLYKLHYFLERVNFDLTMRIQYHVKVYLTLRNQSIKSRTITKREKDKMEDIFQEIKDIYVKYIHLERFFEIPTAVPDALQKRAEDEARDYWYYYISRTVINDETGYLQNEIDERKRK